MSRFYLPTGKEMRRRAAGGNCTAAGRTSGRSAGVSRARQGSSGRRSRAKPRPSGQTSAGTGHRCTEAVAGHSRRVVKCAVQGEKPLCIPPGFEPDTQLFQRPESIRQLGDSRTDIEQQRQYGEHTAEKSSKSSLQNGIQPDSTVR